MIKKVFPILFIFLFTFTMNVVNAQIARSYVPNYLKADFFEKFPDFYKYKLGQKVRYYPTEPDMLGKPDKVRFLSSDGIESVNISGSIWTNAQTETWISLNPADPLNIIATANDNAYLSGQDNWRMSAFVTTDGGATWIHSGTPRNQAQWFSPYQNQATIFDPAITHDSKGNVYYAYGFAETAFDNEVGKNKNGVFVVKSTDKGITWDGIKNGSENGIMAITFDALSSDGNPFHDRYTITADKSSTSPYQDNVYITWRVFGGTDGVVLSTSSDGGENWTAYKRIANGGQAPMPVTGSNGELYVTWIAPDFNNQARAMFAKSTNGGVSFSTVIEAQKVFSIGVYDQSNGRNILDSKQDIRVSSAPQIAVDNSDSPYKGNIYIVQAGRETPTGSYGVYLATSKNGGTSFIKNVRIDNNSLRNDLFFPSITVDPITGYVAVFYYSSQNDTKNIGLDGYVAISQDGGNSWRHLRVTPETKYLDKGNSVMPQGLSGGVYWGDYTSITSHDSRFYPLYWMPTNGNLFSSNDLFTAFISPGPQSPTNLKANTLFEPSLSLKLDWVHPSKNLFGDNLESFKINIFKDEVKIGEVSNASNPTFTDNNVVLSATYKYKLQTELPDGLKSTFAEIDAIVGGNPKPMPPTELTWRPTTNGILLTWLNPVKNVEEQTLNDKLKINVYNIDNNELITSLDNQNIQAGIYTSQVIEVPTNMFYQLNIKAVGVRGSTESESDFSNIPVIAYSGKPFAQISENFDNSQSIIPNYKTGEWILSQIKANSMPSSLSDGPEGNYKRNVNDIFMLPPVLVQSGKSTFSFQHIALLDPYQQGEFSDLGEVSYSDNFGKTWKGVKWVNANSSPNFILGDLANSKFEEIAIDFSENIGDTILIRFRIETNNFREAEGWFIDDINMDDRAADVNESPEMYSTLAISPNPANTNSKLNIRIPVNALVGWEIFNSLGMKVGEQSPEFINEGNHSFNLDIANLTVGSYYIRVKINDSAKSILLNIIR